MTEQELLIKQHIMKADDLVGTIELHIGPFSYNLPEKTIYESKLIGFRYVMQYNYQLIFDGENVIGDACISTNEFIEEV